MRLFHIRVVINMFLRGFSRITGCGRSGRGGKRCQGERIFAAVLIGIAVLLLSFFSGYFRPGEEKHLRRALERVVIIYLQGPIEGSRRKPGSFSGLSLPGGLPGSWNGRQRITPSRRWYYGLTARAGRWPLHNRSPHWSESLKNRWWFPWGIWPLQAVIISPPPGRRDCCPPGDHDRFDWGNFHRCKYG